MATSKSKFAIRYAPEFRRQLVELVRTGRKVSELSREFGCTSWSISRWVAQAERDAGRGDGGLTTAEREELARLPREPVSSQNSTVARAMTFSMLSWFMSCRAQMQPWLLRATRRGTFASI